MITDPKPVAIGGEFLGSRESRLFYVSVATGRLWLVGLFILGVGVDLRFNEVVGRGPSSNILEFVSLVAILTYLADNVIRQNMASTTLRRAFKVNPYFVFFCVSAFFAGCIGVLKYPISFFVFRNIFPAILAFFLVMAYVEKTGDIKKIYILFLFAALPNIGVALSQYLIGIPYIVPANLASSVKMDVDGGFVKIVVVGLFNHPNGLSIFLLPIAIISLGLFLYERNISFLWRLFYIVLFLLSAIVLYMTRAKGAWAWGVIGIAFMCLPLRLIKRNYFWIAAVSVVCLFVLAITQVSLLIGGALNTMVTRIALWGAAIDGVSGSLFSVVFGSAQRDVWFASARVSDLQYSSSHNVYIDQAVIFGVPAAVFYFVAIVYAFRNVNLAARAIHGKGDAMALKILLGVLAGLSGHYFFEPAAESSGLAAVMAIALSLTGVLRFCGKDLP